MKSLKRLRRPTTSWGEDLHPFVGPVMSCDASGRLQSGPSRTGCAVNIENVGGPHHDNNTHRVP
jgi:hypothetical protein